MDTNLIELLLSNSANDIKEDVVISKRIGYDNKFTVRALTNDEVASLRKRSISINKNGTTNIDINKLQELSCIAACVNPNFNDASVIAKAGVGDGVGLLKKLLLPGEINTLYSHINRLSGFDEDINVEIENQKKQ